jgi:hypothetical protein
MRDDNRSGALGQEAEDGGGARRCPRTALVGYRIAARIACGRRTQGGMGGMGIWGMEWGNGGNAEMGTWGNTVQ